MSTKIYNGYYSPLPPDQLLTKFIELRPKFQEIINNEFCKEFVKSTVFDFDQKIQMELLPKDHSFRDFILSEYEISKGKIEKLKPFERGFLIPFDDLGINCIVFPLKKTKTLILFYNETSEVIKFWESQDFIFDYHYQNQSDPPENVSKRNWNQRIKDWDKVLGGNGYGVPSQHGFCYIFCDRELPHFLRTILKGRLKDFVPSTDKRKTNLLHYTMWEECRKELQKNNPEKDLFMSSYYDFNSDFYKKLEKGDLIKELKAVELQKLPMDENF